MKNNTYTLLGCLSVAGSRQNLIGEVRMPHRGPEGGGDAAKVAKADAAEKAAREKAEKQAMTAEREAQEDAADPGAKKRHEAAQRLASALGALRKVEPAHPFGVEPGSHAQTLESAAQYVGMIKEKLQTFPEAVSLAEETLSRLYRADTDSNFEPAEKRELILRQFDGQMRDVVAGLGGSVNARTTAEFAEAMRPLPPWLTEGLASLTPGPRNGSDMVADSQAPATPPESVSPGSVVVATATPASSPTSRPAEVALATRRADALVGGVVEKTSTKLTDKRRLDIAAGLGFSRAQLQEAFNAKNKDGAELVAAVRKGQGEVWDALSEEQRKELPPKLRSRSGFMDGVWGGGSQGALEKLVSIAGANPKWGKMAKILRQGFAVRAPGEAGGDKVAEGSDLEAVKIPPVRAPELRSKPERIDYPLASNRQVDEYDPKTATENDILTLNTDVGGYKEGTPVKVVRVIEQKEGLQGYQGDNVRLMVRTADGKDLTLGVGDLDDASEAGAKEYSGAEHGAALTAYREAKDSDRSQLNAQRDAWKDGKGFEGQRYFATVDRDVQLTARGARGGASMKWGRIKSGEQVAVLGSTGDEYKVITKNGREGYIPSSAIDAQAVVKRGETEDTTTVLAGAGDQFEASLDLSRLAATVQGDGSTRVTDKRPGEAVPPAAPTVKIAAGQVADEGPPAAINVEAARLARQETLKEDKAKG